MCFEGMKPVNQTAAASKGLRGLLHPQQLQLMSRQLDDPNGSFANGVLRAQIFPLQSAVIVREVWGLSLYLQWILAGGLAFICKPGVAFFLFSDNILVQFETVLCMSRGGL